MKKFISFLFLLHVCNAIHCMELALQQGKLKSDEEIIREIIISAQCLDMISRVNFAKTCKRWYHTINPTKMWYQNVHPGPLNEEDCKDLNTTCYIHAMIYYAHQNDTHQCNFIHENTKEDNKKLDSSMCGFLKKNVMELYRHDYDEIIKDLTSYWHTSISPHKEEILLPFMVRIFLLQGKNVNFKNKDGDALLHFIAKGNTKFFSVNQIMNHPDIDVNVKNKDGYTPLLSLINCPECVDGTICRHQKRIEYRLHIAKELLSKNADPNIQNNWGNTPLINATALLRKDIVEILLENKKTDPNIKNKDGNSALHYAIKAFPVKFKEQVVKLLLENEKIDPNNKDKGGNSPLHYAVQEVDVVSVGNPALQVARITFKATLNLINHPNIQINIKNNAGHTPLDYTGKDCRTKNLIPFLLKKGAIYGSFFQNHKTMIQICSLFGILGLIGTGIFAYFHHNSNPITQ